MPDAIQTLITKLQQNKSAPDGKPEPVSIPIETFIAALNEIEASIGPAPGPYLPLAGGTMTGPFTADGITDPGIDSFGAIAITLSTTAVATGFAKGGLSILACWAGGANVWQANGGGMYSTTAGGWFLPLNAAGATRPTVCPDQTDQTTGLGAQAAGNFSLIAAATEIARIVSTGLTMISGLLTLTGGTLLATSAALTNNAGSSAGTLTNAPAVGNPTKWIPINDNGTIRNIPAW